MQWFDLFPTNMTNALGDFQ